MARPHSDKYTGTFEHDQKFWMGENHYPTPTSHQHLARDAWKAKPTRNYLFQVIDFKKAIVLDANPTIHVEPLQTDIPTDVLELTKNVVQHELDRLRWNDIREDVFLDGAVTGKGIAHIFSEKDPFSGEMKLCAELVDPRRFYPDPSASRLSEARFVVYEPMLDLSKIRNTFPEKGHLVKAAETEPFSKLPTTQTRQRSNDELVYAPGNEIMVDSDGKMKQRKAAVAFVWLKDETLMEETREKVYNESPKPMPDFSMMEGPELETVLSRKYPYGRLICISGEVLLYDGPSPYELESVFPFADYSHYRIPRRYWGYGDVALLKSVQLVADKNAAMLLDAQRMTSMGIFETPIGAEGYTNPSNQPGSVVPVPPELSGLARWVNPNGYNAQLHSILDEMTHRDVQITSGISDVSAGLSPTAPTSGVEVQARQRAASTRIGQHLKEMNEFSSDFANIVFQLMKQLYVGMRPFLVRDELSEVQSIAIDVSQLPPGMAIKVNADPDDIERDRLQGQNVQGFITGVLANPMMAQQVVPYIDILLPAIGLKPQKAKELQKRMMMNLAAMPMPGVLGNGATPGAPPPGNDSGEAQAPAATGMTNQDAAYAAMGV